MSTPAIPALRLEDCGAVLTDTELARLMQRPPTWPGYERAKANRLRIAPDLPEPIGGWPAPGKRGPKRYRYDRRAVDAWMSGQLVRRIRRVS